MMIEENEICITCFSFGILFCELLHICTYCLEFDLPFPRTFFELVKIILLFFSKMKNQITVMGLGVPFYR
jgi:hypothetical protein